MERLNKILSHIVKSNRKSQLQLIKSKPMVSERTDDDIVIVCAIRTPLCKANKGGLKDTHPVDLLSVVLKGIIDKTGINPSDVEDIHVGNVEINGGGAFQARLAMFIAGYPETTCLTTLNRQCSSGLQALANIAGAIKSGYINIGIAAGFEAMSFTHKDRVVGPISPSVLLNDLARDCLLSMGQTSENVSERFGITRKEQDEFGLLSQQKAITAQKNGEFKDEIVPVDTYIIDEKGEKKKILLLIKMTE